MVVISHAYTSAWDPGAKDDSFAARVNQTILRNIIRDDLTGATSRIDTTKVALPPQVEALSSLPLPSPQWNQAPVLTVPGPQSELTWVQRNYSTAPNGCTPATCQPDISTREAGGNEADIQLPISRYEQSIKPGLVFTNPPLTTRTNREESISRPHTARPSTTSSKADGRISALAGRGNVTARAQFSTRAAAKQPGAKAEKRKEPTREAWGQKRGGPEFLSIRGSTPNAGTRPASTASSRSKLTLDLTSLRNTTGSATPAYRTFRMPRSPAVQSGPAAQQQLETPPPVQQPKKGVHQPTASVQILCLESPRSDGEAVHQEAAAAGHLKAGSKSVEQDREVALVRATPATKQEAGSKSDMSQDASPEVLEARSRLERARTDAIKYPLLARVRRSRQPVGKQPSQAGAQVIPTRNSAGQIVGEVEIPPDVVNGEGRAEVVPMVVDRNAWRRVRLTGPEEENAREAMRRASLHLWRNANGGYVVPSKPIVSDYADKMRYKPEEQDRLDITYHSRKSAFKELIEIELMYRQRDRLAKRDM